MATVGRDRELDAIAAFLAPESVSTSVLLLEGEPGIGKTTLWQASIATAGTRDLRVLRASPSQPEQGLAFAGLSDLLGPFVLALTADLPDPQLQALRVALRLDIPGDTQVDAGTIAFATLGALARLAADLPVLVAVDDVQWLDRPSADALAFAVRRLASSDVRFLLARRVEEPVPAALASALVDVGATVIPLGPLSVGATQRIVHQRIGTALSRPVLHRVHETSAGNPLFAIELARALAEAPTPAAGEPLQVPAALRDLIEDRLIALPPSTEEALRVAALIGQPTQELVATVLGREVDIDPAVQAGVVESDSTGVIRFGHPLLASGLAARLSPTRRRSLHMTLAATVASIEERAFHVLASRPGTDPIAAGLVDEAAASARARGASAAAADLLEGALTLTDAADLDSRHRRLLLASEAARDAGDWKRAELHARAAVDLAREGQRRAEALLALAAVSPAVQLESAEEALLHANGDPRVEARAHLVISDSQFHIDARRALDATRRALEAATRTDDTALLAAAHSAVGYLEETCLDGEPLSHLAEAVALERAGAVVPSDFSPEIALATLRMWRDEHDEARAGFGRASVAATARGDAFGTMTVDNHLAMVEWRAGRWDRALELAEQAVTTWEASGDPGGVAVVLYCRGFIHAHLGHVDEALADVAGAREARAPGALMAARCDWVEGHVALARGDIAHAAGLLAQTSSTFDRLGFVQPGLRLYLSDALEAFVADGRLSEAEALAEPLVELGRRHGLARATAIGLRGRGMVLAAHGDLDAAIQELENGVASLDAFPVPFEHARTWLALGSVQRRARHRRAARERLQQSVARFESLGARLWEDRARAELARIGGRAPSDGELTPTEHSVAGLVAEGRTNKEVAAAMVVSVHTVEAALTSIYGKLDVRSRTELTRKLAG